MEFAFYVGGVLIGYGAGLNNGAKKGNRYKGNDFIYLGLAVCVGVGVYREFYMI
jgi:hypothetical protein